VFHTDLHCHSTISDGLLTPADVVTRAVNNGVSLLALTDHDSCDGFFMAREAAFTSGIRLISGAEISILWNTLQVHIVGLNFDEGNETLAKGLESIRLGRIGRAKRMAAALNDIGISGCFEGAMRHVKTPNLIGRSHFARYLVERGICKDVHSVFESYLVPGKSGYVTHQWITLEEAIGWIVGAGGVAVIAHPCRYKFSRTDLKRLFDEFKSLGGRGIEIVSGAHSAGSINSFAQLARDYGFLVSCGSDFHGPDESFVDIGHTPRLPAGLTPIWEAF